MQNKSWRSSRKPRAFMQTGQILTETRIQAYVAQLGKGRKKAQSKDTDKDKTADKNSTDNKEAYQVTPTLVPHPSGGQPTPPSPSHLPPLFLAPPPRYPTVNTWPLLGPYTASTPFSVQQPCGSHVTLAVPATQRAPSPQSRWRPSPPWPSPSTAVGPTLPS